MLHDSNLAPIKIMPRCAKCSLPNSVVDLTYIKFLPFTSKFFIHLYTCESCHKSINKTLSDFKHLFTS